MGDLLNKVKKMGRAAARLRQAENSQTCGCRERTRLREDTHADLAVLPDLDETLDNVALFLDLSSGLAIRRLDRVGREAAVIYFEEMVDRARLESGVILPLLRENRAETPDAVLKQVVPSAKGRRLVSIQDIVWAVLDGECAVMSQGWTEALAFDVRGGDKRDVTEPEMEVTLKGPRQGFVEDISTNVSLIRRRIRHPSLRLISLTMGRLTRTRVVLLYLQGVARPDVVAEMLSRLKRIDVDAVQDPGYLIEFIEDSPVSPFPQIGISERPDRVTSGLTQGRVAVLVDGSPSAMVAPFPAVTFLQSPDDYYDRWTLSLVTRVTRLASIFISLFFPAVYVALTAYHQEIIPRQLALTIAVQRELIPYPVLLETLALIIVFEIVTEASVRLPRPMGQTIGIVGTLVIGESAVRANLVSNVTVIVVAATAVAQFTVTPDLTTSIRLLRLPVLILGSLLGLYGIFAAAALLLLHAASLRSLGLPYLAPYAPTSMRDMQDATVRLPWWTQVHRPSILGAMNPVRIRSGQKPSPPQDRSDRIELETKSGQGSTSSGRSPQRRR